MDRQTMLEIAALKDRVNELGQRISEHYMGLHAESAEGIVESQDAILEVSEDTDSRIAEIEDALIELSESMEV